MPFPSTVPMHPRWAEHHAPVSEGRMNARVTITHGQTGGGWDPETGPIPAVPTVTYVGRAALAYDSSKPAAQTAADQPLTTRPVLLSLPLTAAAQTEGARVHVDLVDANGPSGLTGRWLTITADSPTSEGFDVVYLALDDQSNQPEE
jgi:hypothetical protein